jgi:hypothetical protein
LEVAGLVALEVREKTTQTPETAVVVARADIQEQVVMGQTLILVPTQQMAQVAVVAAAGGPLLVPTAATTVVVVAV